VVVVVVVVVVVAIVGVVMVVVVVTAVAMGAVKIKPCSLLWWHVQSSGCTRVLCMGAGSPFERTLDLLVSKQRRHHQWRKKQQRQHHQLQRRLKKEGGVLLLLLTLLLELLLHTTGGQVATGVMLHFLHTMMMMMNWQRPHQPKSFPSPKRNGKRRSKTLTLTPPRHLIANSARTLDQVSIRAPVVVLVIRAPELRVNK
jgi:hypothetical protein